jgi:hypothetical protein
MGYHFQLRSDPCPLRLDSTPFECAKTECHALGEVQDKSFLGDRRYLGTRNSCLHSVGPVFVCKAPTKENSILGSGWNRPLQQKAQMWRTERRRRGKEDVIYYAMRGPLG